MKRIVLLLALISGTQLSMAQLSEEPQDTALKNNYRASSTKINSLVHTKLDVRFDFNKAYMYGKEWLTAKPTFYPTDSIVLDAKGMDIKMVALIDANKRIPLQYTYDSLQLHIALNKTYSSKELYTLYFEYTSKPNEFKAEGSAAITDAKGLYFINPTGSEKNKPTQIWTQGETESNSVWMITIDKPNQKSTEEISITIPNKYVTLSNGLLISQKKNTDGTRTDNWKMDLPHAPYLFFMGVGDFAIVRDSYKGKEVNYYVEKSYQPYAKGIFGNTPEMMGFYSKKLGVEYPWPKYSQIVGRDFVSGAMENTTSTLHQESAYQNARELSDGNEWEETIAHELFHHWFGDLVTAESWSNITVNESFANYSEYLWDEYKHGKDWADAHGFEDMQGYLMSGGEKKDLVRFFYNSREDVFDGVSYNKGGRILHMLRNYVGDDAFFASLHNYLTTNQFKTGEAHQLRLAFEEVTGKDLNWFWNQWYYSSGHPKLKINYTYDSSGYAGVVINQTQKSGKAFILPIAVDVYIKGNKERHPITINKLSDTFYFKCSEMPELINVDAEKILLAEKNDNKSADNFKAQWKYAKNYLDRKEAIDYFAKNKMPELANGLSDPFYKIRMYTIQKISSISSLKNDEKTLSSIENIAKNDKNRKVIATALSFLLKTKDSKYLPLYEKAINDSSYNVAGTAFKGIAQQKPEEAYALAKKYSTDAKGILGQEVIDVLIEKGTEADFDFVAKHYDDAPLSQEKVSMTEKFANYLLQINDLSKIKTGINAILSFRKMIPEQYRSYIDGSFKKSFDKLSASKGNEIKEYIENNFK